MSDNQSPAGGISLVGAVGLLFLGLKLGHVIDWSWWLVLLPFYGAISLIGAVIVLTLAGAGATAGVKAAKRRREINRLRANPATGSGRRVSISERRDGQR